MATETDLELKYAVQVLKQRIEHLKNVLANIAQNTKRPDLDRDTVWKLQMVHNIASGALEDDENGN